MSSAMMSERLAGLHHSLEDGQHRLQRGELLLVDEDVGILELGNHFLGIGDEIGREIAAVELHALDNVQFGLEALGLLDRDDALVADLLHRIGDHLADRLVAIGGDRADLRDFRRFLDLLRTLGDVLDRLGDREVDAALEVHRVHAGRNQLRAFAHDRLGEDRGGGRAVAGGVIGLGGDLAHHLCAHVLELVVELDFLGDGHAVLGDARRAERLVENDIAALGAQRHLDGVGENVDAAQHLLARVGGKTYVFSSHLESSSARRLFSNQLMTTRFKSQSLRRQRQEPWGRVVHGSSPPGVARQGRGRDGLWTSLLMSIVTGL